MDSDDQQTKDMEQGLGLAEQDADIKAAFFTSANRRQGVKFIKSEDQTLDEFVAAALAGTLLPSVRSAPAPRRNSGPVKTVVATTFSTIVEDPDQDCLIAFCNPFSANCKKFAPLYIKLAKKLKNVPGLTIASMDVSSNDLPATYNVVEQPALYLLKNVWRKDGVGGGGGGNGGHQGGENVDAGGKGGKGDMNGGVEDWSSSDAVTAVPPGFRYGGDALSQKQILEFLESNGIKNIPKRVKRETAKGTATRAKQKKTKNDVGEGGNLKQGTQGGSQVEGSCAAPRPNDRGGGGGERNCKSEP